MDNFFILKIEIKKIFYFNFQKLKKKYFYYKKERHQIGVFLTCINKPNSVSNEKIFFEKLFSHLMVDIYLGPQLLSGSSDSLQQKVEARSCTRVSILPFHPNLIGSSLFATL